MACIFYEVPYVFFGVRKNVFLWCILCAFFLPHFQHLMIWMFSFRQGIYFLLLRALKTRIAGHAIPVFHQKISFSQKILFCFCHLNYCL